MPSTAYRNSTEPKIVRTDIGLSQMAFVATWQSEAHNHTLWIGEDGSLDGMVWQTNRALPNGTASTAAPASMHPKAIARVTAAIAGGALRAGA